MQEFSLGTEGNLKFMEDFEVTSQPIFLPNQYWYHYEHTIGDDTSGS